MKPKNCAKETIQYFQTTTFDNTIGIQMMGEIPNQELYQHQGSIVIGPRSDLDSIQAIPVSSKNMLLRGAFLRSTDWILGAVVYTGMDTKIMKNAEEGRPKFSDMET